MDVRTLVTVYKTLIQPQFDYCSQVWGCLGITLQNHLQRLQNSAARNITKRGYEFRSADILKELDLPNLWNRIFESSEAECKDESECKDGWQDKDKLDIEVVFQEESESDISENKMEREDEKNSKKKVEASGPWL